MIKDEVEPLGGFIGDAYVQPMFLGGQALTAIIFIMMQNFMLSFIVIALLAVQMVIVPRLRKPVLILGRQRQLSARLLAGRIAETADGVNEIHIHGAANYERADISERLGHIFRIRFDLYNKKFVASSGTTSSRRRLRSRSTCWVAISPSPARWMWAPWWASCSPTRICRGRSRS